MVAMGQTAGKQCVGHLLSPHRPSATILRGARYMANTGRNKAGPKPVEHSASANEGEGDMVEAFAPVDGDAVDLNPKCARTLELEGEIRCERLRRSRLAALKDIMRAQPGLELLGSQGGPQPI